MSRGDFTERELFNEGAMLEIYGDRPAVKTYLATRLKDAASYFEELRKAIEQGDLPNAIFQATKMHRVAYGMRSEGLMRLSMDVVIVAVRRDVEQLDELAKALEAMLARVNAYLLAKGWLES